MRPQYPPLSAPSWCEAVRASSLSQSNSSIHVQVRGLRCHQQKLEIEANNGSYTKGFRAPQRSTIRRHQSSTYSGQSTISLTCRIRPGFCSTVVRAGTRRIRTSRRGLSAWLSRSLSRSLRSSASRCSRVSSNTRSRLRLIHSSISWSARGSILVFSVAWYACVTAMWSSRSCARFLRLRENSRAAIVETAGSEAAAEAWMGISVEPRCGVFVGLSCI